MIIPTFKQLQQKMKNETENLKVLIKNIKDELTHPLSVFSVKYDYDKFVSEVQTPSKFFKKLSNSKTSILGFGTNREWWKNLKPNGVYRYFISDGEIIIKFYMETITPINERELKLRLYKVLRPKEMEFHLNDNDNYIKLLPEIIEEVKEGIQLYGGITKSDLEDLKNVNDLMNSDYPTNLTETDET